MLSTVEEYDLEAEAIDAKGKLPIKWGEVKSHEPVVWDR